MAASRATGDRALHDREQRPTQPSPGHGHRDKAGDLVVTTAVVTEIHDVRPLVAAAVPAVVLVVVVAVVGLRGEGHDLPVLA
jgi:hypothetical protein